MSDRRLISLAWVATALTAMVGIGAIAFLFVPTRLGVPPVEATPIQPVLRRVGTAAAFSERLRDEVDMERVTSDLTMTTGVAVAPASIGIWIRHRAAGR